MTESPELKSPSESTPPERSEVAIMPLATPFHANVALKERDLKEKFDDHWLQNGEMLCQKYYKGKKGPGGSLNTPKARKVVENTLGVNRLYSDIIADMIGTAVEKETGKRIMFVTDLLLNDFDTPDKPTVGIMQYYYWPKLTMPEPLNFELKSSGDRDFEKAFTARCEQLRQSYKTFTTTDIIKSENQRLSMDILTAINGKPSEEHTKRSVWVEVEDLHPPEVKDAVLASKIGELVELSFMDGEDEINVHVKVYAANDIVRMDLDDEDLYISAGNESKADFRAKFQNQFEKQKEVSEQGQCYSDLTMKIMTTSDMENIPNAWLTSNIDRFVDRHVDSQGGNLQKAMEVVGVQTEDALRKMFEGQVYKETVQQMANMWYADEFDCLADNQSIAADMRSRVIWVD